MTEWLAKTFEVLLREAGIHPVATRGCLDTPVAGLCDHASQACRHFLYLARRGTTTDGHLFVEEAARNGAGAFLVDREIPCPPGAAMALVPDARRAAGLLVQAFYNHPTRHMTLAGVTGSNGKTTVTHFLEAISRAAGLRVGLIGSLGCRWGDGHSDAFETTTPSPLEIGSLLARMADDGIEVVAMEVSSQAIDQDRIAGIPFHVGALTNVTREHIEYHDSMPDYVAIKRRFFFDHVARVPGSTAVLNLDDAVGEELAFSYNARHIGYTMDPDRCAAVDAFDVRMGRRGMSFQLALEGRKVEVRTSLIGAYNLQNILAAAGMALAMGIDARSIAVGIERMRGVPGRFERIATDRGFEAIVDRAHTPAALDRMLHSARRIAEQRLIVVFGCGGHRDPKKPAMMGSVAARYADLILATRDNTRGDDPEPLAREILRGATTSGLSREAARIELDRQRAIEAALHMARPGDVVVVAGRGHEDTLDLGDEKIPFDDREVVARVIRDLETGTAGMGDAPPREEPQPMGAGRTGPALALRNPKPMYWQE